MEEVIQKTSTDKLVRDSHAAKCVKLAKDLAELMCCKKSWMYNKICDRLEEKGMLSLGREYLPTAPISGLTPFSDKEWAAKHHPSFPGLE